MEVLRDFISGIGGLARSWWDGWSLCGRSEIRLIALFTPPEAAAEAAEAIPLVPAHEGASEPTISK